MTPMTSERAADAWPTQTFRFQRPAECWRAISIADGWRRHVRRYAPPSGHNGAGLQECVPVFSAERSRMLLMLMGSFSPRAPPPQPRRSQRTSPLARSDQLTKQMPPVAQKHVCKCARAFLACLTVYTVQRVHAFVRLRVTEGKRWPWTLPAEPGCPRRLPALTPPPSSCLSGTARAPFHRPEGPHNQCLSTGLLSSC